jgi:hypothetical protein
MKKRRIALLGVLAVLVTVWVWSAPAPPREHATQPASGAARAGLADERAAQADTPVRPHAETAAPASPSPPAPAVPPAFDIEEATTRLKARIASAPAPRSPERNPFDFERAPAPAAHVAAPVTRATGAPPLPAGPPPPPQVTLSGIAERKTGEGLVRTAIINGPGQLYFAKVGDRVAGRYEVSFIGVDIVELKDLNDATRRVRLTMR